MIALDIKSDIADLEKQLSHLGASTKYVLIDMLRKTGRGALSAVKKGYKQYLKQPTGRLYRGYKSTVNRRSGYAIVRNPTRQYIANAHEKGSLIKAKNYKCMTYNIGGKWFKSKQVQLKAVPFFSEGTQSYASGQLQQDIDTLMKKAVDRFNDGKL